MSEYRVQFEVFEGPLDLLLHLVRKQEVDVYQINLARLASDFMAYIEQMRELDLEVAGEFVVMAASLVYIKSRELLPVTRQVRSAEDEMDGDDPRWELIRRLVEYRKFKDAAATLQQHEELQENVYERRPARPDFLREIPVEKRGPLSIFDLVHAVGTLLKRHRDRADVSDIEADPYTVSEKMESLREWVGQRRRLRLTELFGSARSRTEVVVTFLALLELVRMHVVQCWQSEEFGDIELEACPEPPPDLPPDLPPPLPPADIVPPTPAPSAEHPPDPTPLGTRPDSPEIA